MTDYLQTMGRPLRFISIILSFLAAAVALFAALIVGNDMIRRGSFYYEGKPLWIAELIVIALSFAAGYVGLRLLAGKVSTNGSTVLPNWFIQIFGIAFLCGIIFVAWRGNHPEMFIEGPSIAIAMILIGRHATKKKRIHFLRRLISLNAADRERVLAQMSPGNRDKIQKMLNEHAYDQNKMPEKKPI